jgi:phage gpG-like protein
VADLTIVAETNLGNVLTQLEAQGRNVDKALPIIGEMLVGAVQDVFEAEGPGWKELDPATELRRRGGPPYKILQDTGVLAGSVAARYGSTYVEAVDGTTYGIYHAPDPQRRDWTELGPFEQPLLDEVAELLLSHF